MNVMIETASMNLSVFAVLFLGCVSSVSSVRAFIPTHLAVRRTLNPCGSRLYGILEDVSDMKLPSMDNLKVPDMPVLPSLGGEGVNKLMASSLSSTMVASVAATVIILGVFAAAANSSGSNAGNGKMSQAKKRKKASEFAIDYHSAARMAYQEWLQDHPDEKSKPDAYAAFEDLYEAHAVAIAASKKLARDLQAFDNRPAQPIPPRKMTMKKIESPSTTKSSKFFFASE